MFLCLWKPLICNDTANKLRSKSIRPVRLENHLTIRSNLYDAWKQLAGDAHNVTSTIIYQHVLQYFWSCVALQGRTDQSLHWPERASVLKWPFSVFVFFRSHKLDFPFSTAGSFSTWRLSRSYLRFSYVTSFLSSV